MGPAGNRQPAQSMLGLISPNGSQHNRQLTCYRRLTELIILLALLITLCVHFLCLLLIFCEYKPLNVSDTINTKQ